MSSKRRVSHPLKKSRKQKRLDQLIEKNMNNYELTNLIWDKLNKINKKLPTKIYVRMLVTDQNDDLRKIASLKSNKLANFIENQLFFEKNGLPLVFKPITLNSLKKNIFS